LTQQIISENGTDNHTYNQEKMQKNQNKKKMLRKLAPTKKTLKIKQNLKTKV